MADEPENYLDTAHNPTFQGMREMQITLADMGEYCLLVRKGYDPTVPRELRKQAFDEARQHTRLAMFCSNPGLGKTFLGKRVLKKAGLRVPSNELNPNNPASLSYELWNLRRHGYEVAPIDDADRLMRSDPMIGLMKHGWNGDDPQINCFMTERIRKNEEYRVEGSDRYNPSVPPPSFEYRLATPWFANKNLTTPGGLAQHTHPDFTALIDRGLRPRWINSDPRNVFFYTLWMMERGGLLKEFALSLAESQDTLDVFVDAALRLQHPHPNLRLATELAKVRKAPDYKVLWSRVISESLAVSAGLPRAIDKNDLTVRPDLRRAVEEARKVTERRKDAAARAVAEARAATERAKAEREEAEREADEVALREAAEIAAAFEAASTSSASFPEVPEVLPLDAVRGAAAAPKPKVKPQDIFKPYTGASMLMPPPLPEADVVPEGAASEASDLPDQPEGAAKGEAEPVTPPAEPAPITPPAPEAPAPAPVTPPAEPEAPAPVTSTTGTKRRGRGREPVVTEKKLKEVIARFLKPLKLERGLTCATVLARVQPVWDSIVQAEFQGDYVAIWRAYMVRGLWATADTSLDGLAVHGRAHDEDLAWFSLADPANVLAWSVRGFVIRPVVNEPDDGGSGKTNGHATPAQDTPDGGETDTAPGGADADPDATPPETETGTAGLSTNGTVVSPMISQSAAALKRLRTKAIAPDREAVIQSIAAMLFRRFPECMVTGSAEGVRIDAFDQAKLLFCRATLPPHPDVEDAFSLNILDKHEGKFLTEQGGPIHTAEIKDGLAWDLTLGPEAKSALVAECKICKAKGIKDPAIVIEDGRLTLTTNPPDAWAFKLRDLEWVLRKDVVEIRFLNRGIMCLLARTDFGHYEFFLRGKPY